jgi:hypothetical protein
MKALLLTATLVLLSLPAYGKLVNVGVTNEGSQLYLDTHSVRRNHKYHAVDFTYYIGKVSSATKRTAATKYCNSDLSKYESVARHSTGAIRFDKNGDELGIWTTYNGQGKLVQVTADTSASRRLLFMVCTLSGSWDENI